MAKEAGETDRLVDEENIMRKCIIAAPLVAAALLSAPLAAEVQKRPVVVEGSAKPLPTTRSVGFADLDLRETAGQAALYARIKRAVHSLCDTSMSTIPLYSKMWQRNCIRETSEAVAPQVAYVIERAYLRDNSLAAANSLTIALQP